MYNQTVRVRTIPTFWWNEEPNFGDSMNPMLLERLFGVHATWAPLECAELMAAGSVIQGITPVARKRQRPIHVWGSGFIFGDEPAPPLSSVFYHAVRGKNSATMSGIAGLTVYGDPGLLASCVVEKPRIVRKAIGFVPHLWHRSDPVLRDLIIASSALFIDVCANPLDVIRQIASCDFIFSSSLHGLIVADSFGIPNCWLTADPALLGGRWKFNDYYSVFGVERRPISVRPDLDVRKIVNIHETKYFRPDLDTLQNELVLAFPFGS